MQQQLLSAKSRVRMGFTIVEFIVALITLGLLAALIIPQIQHARTPSRRTACQSNLRNVGLALHAYATAHQGRLPPLVGGGKLKRASPSLHKQLLDMSWPVHLLPYLEEGKAYDELITGQYAAPVDPADKSIETFLCPDYPNPGSGSLSYVANSGAIAADAWSRVNDTSHQAELYDFGFNGYLEDGPTNEDRSVAYSTGILWRSVPEGDNGISIPLSMDEISQRDGTSQTVMFAENLDTRRHSKNGLEGGWASDATGDLAFGFSVSGERIGTAFRVKTYEQSGGIGKIGNSDVALTIDPKQIDPICRINTGMENSTPTRANPRPSSNHPGVVNMAFADGSCKVISQDIALDVYVRLLSPAGNRYGQDHLSSADF